MYISPHAPSQLTDEKPEINGKRKDYGGRGEHPSKIALERRKRIIAHECRGE
jgi:hypothetical protein